MASELVDSPVVLHQADSAAVQLVPFCRGKAGIYSRRSPFRTTLNEDGAALFPWNHDAGVLIVADGVGGARLGNEASGIAIESLLTTIDRAKSPSQLRPAIMDGLERANDRILRKLAGAATTVVVVEVQGTDIRTYHVGDSGVLLVGNRAKVKYRTMAHSPVGLAQGAGWIDESEALHHEQRHYISNFLGSPKMRIEIGSRIQMAPRDTLLLATDGVLDNLHESELIEIIRRGPMDKCLSSLAGSVYHRMVNPEKGSPSKPDDATFICYRGGSNRS